MCTTNRLPQDVHLICSFKLDLKDKKILGLYFCKNSPDSARLREWEEVRQSLLALLRRLPAAQAQAIQMHYGLDGYVPHSQPEIAKRLGVSRQWISQVEIAALVWLRQPAHSQELRSLRPGMIKPSMSWPIDWRRIGCGGGEGDCPADHN